MKAIVGGRLKKQKPDSLQVPHVRVGLGTAAVTKQECGGLFPLNATN